MKKLFTFFTALLLAGSMWGAAYFSYDATTKDNITTTTGCVATLYSCEQAKSNNVYGIKFDANTDSIKIVLSDACAMSAGDTLRVAAFTTAGTPSNNYKVIFSTTSSANDAFYTFDLTQKTNVCNGEFIVTEALNNLKTFYVLCNVPSSKNLILQTLSLTQGKTIVSQNYWGFKKNGAGLNNPADYTYDDDTNTATLNDSYKSNVAPEDYTWTNHIVYSDASTKDENIAVEFAQNGNFWEATHEFDDKTVTIKVPVDKTVNVYVHFVEDWASNNVWSAVGTNWAPTTTETIGGCTWHKTTYNNTGATTFQISYNGSVNSVVQNLAADVTGDVYFVAYNKWENGNFVLREVTDPTRKTLNVYFKAPNWENLSDFSFWAEDGVEDASVYGTQADYVFTQTATFAGESWHKATIHYFGAKCDLYLFFYENDVTWKGATVLEATEENVYVCGVTYAAETDNTHKTFNYTLTDMKYFEGPAATYATISENTYWDWAKADVTEVKLTDATYPSKTDEFVLANALAANISFNSEALVVSGEYLVREGNYFQGGKIKFTTTVSGFVKVVFSNTGNRSAGQERWLHVNGVKTAYGALTTAQVTSGWIPVAAGDVVLTSKMNGNNDDQYLRVYSVEFATSADLTLGANGYSTFCAPFYFNVEGATVYTAELNDAKTSVTLHEVTGVVPANAGVILHGATEATITPAAYEAVTLPANDLVGVLANTNLDANYTYYVLATEAGVTAFHPYDGAYIPAGKACLKVAAANAPERIAINSNPVATGVENVTAAKAVKALVNGNLVIVRNGAMFNLNGMLVK